jgi:hypothetical protein
MHSFTLKAMKKLYFAKTKENELFVSSYHNSKKSVKLKRTK